MPSAITFDSGGSECATVLERWSQSQTRAVPAVAIAIAAPAAVASNGAPVTITGAWGASPNDGTDWRAAGIEERVYPTITFPAAPPGPENRLGSTHPENWGPWQQGLSGSIDDPSVTALELVLTITLPAGILGGPGSNYVPIYNLVAINGVTVLDPTGALAGASISGAPGTAANPAGPFVLQASVTVPVTTGSFVVIVDFSSMHASATVLDADLDDWYFARYFEPNGEQVEVPGDSTGSKELAYATSAISGTFTVTGYVVTSEVQPGGAALVKWQNEI